VLRHRLGDGDAPFRPPRSAVELPQWEAEMRTSWLMLSILTSAACMGESGPDGSYWTYGRPGSTRCAR
jgi:hypothetical protein